VDQADFPVGCDLCEDAGIGADGERVLGRQVVDADQFAASADEFGLEAAALAGDERSGACGRQRFGHFDGRAFGPAGGEVRDYLQDRCPAQRQA